MYSSYYGYPSSSYGYSSGTDGFSIWAIVALVLALISTVVILIAVIPEKKRASLPKGLQVLHDIFNFNGLILEKILKTLYIFLTIASVLILFGALFTVNSFGAFIGALITLVLTPIAIRVVFEFSMLAILLVKNVISINRKLKSQNDSNANGDGFSFDYSKYTAGGTAPSSNPGAQRPSATVYCPNCGTPVTGDATFCPNCGTDVTK